MRVNLFFRFIGADFLSNARHEFGIDPGKDEFAGIDMVHFAIPSAEEAVGGGSVGVVEFIRQNESSFDGKDHTILEVFPGEAEVDPSAEDRAFRLGHIDANDSDVGIAERLVLERLVWGQNDLGVEIGGVVFDLRDVDAFTCFVKVDEATIDFRQVQSDVFSGEAGNAEQEVDGVF